MTPDMRNLAQSLVLDWSRVQQWLLGPGLSILAVLVLALLARWLLHRAIDRAVALMSSRAAARLTALGAAKPSGKNAPGPDPRQGPGERHASRVGTLGSLLRSIVTFVVTLVTVMTVMAVLGLPLGPLLASAGVGGLALGFGAQSLVKDFLSGVFMIFEDQYGVGDIVDTGEAIGTVEEVGLRVTRLRDATGVVWYVRNGEILRVGNRSQGWSTAIVDVPVAYDEDPERVIALMREVLATVRDDPEWAQRLLDQPDTVGVESITNVAMTVRSLTTCRPNDHFAVQRELRERYKRALDAAGVRAPVALPEAVQP